jgi:uncharacterized protein
MKRLILSALLTSTSLLGVQHACAQTASAPTAAAAPAPLPSSPAKKELVKKLLVLQQPGIENLATGLVEQSALQLLQAADGVLQQMPAEKRESIGKTIQADVRKFVDEAVPIVRERAVKLAPASLGVPMEEKFTEDELKQLVAWLESPVSKKHAEFNQGIQNGFSQELLTETRPVVGPRFQVLEAKVRATLGVPSPKAPAPAKKASGK